MNDKMNLYEDSSCWFGPVSQGNLRINNAKTQRSVK